MNFYVLSQLTPGVDFVGQSVNFSFEQTLASTCDTSVTNAAHNSSIKLPGNLRLSDEKFGFTRSYRHRLFKNWFDIENPPKLGKGPNVLLVVCLYPDRLLSMFALGRLLEQFDVKMAYILDGFDPTHIDREVKDKLDHLFVISAEIADQINQANGPPTSFLPLATDALMTPEQQLPRFIDVISYGRGNKQVHQKLQSHYIQQPSQRFYWHSTFAKSEIESHREHQALLAKMLGCAKLSLCFEASDLPRFMGYSPILYRWYEAWASGCTVVGKRPFGKGSATLMDWENSAIDLPQEPSAWIPFIEALLDDTETLKRNALRNRHAALSRHDWRYRIQDILKTAGLTNPPRLNQGLDALQLRAAELEAQLQAG